VEDEHPEKEHDTQAVRCKAVGWAGGDRQGGARESKSYKVVKNTCAGIHAGMSAAMKLAYRKC